MKYDGSVILNTKIDTSGFEDDSKSLKKTASDLTKEGPKIVAPFKDLAKADALADIAVNALRDVGEAMKQLAVESIDAAADIRAENAQFSETFKEMENTAADALDAIARDVGITASRMKQSYTKTFAFTKSVGADSEEAMDIANRAMRAAADSAAYYDRSIEDATETLQSFLKGNYENDAALGIAATETTRNAKANELYAKSFQDLSEAQKVDVLLAMVEAGNEASGALGQAAREADAWTNVQGELNEAWRQLLGTFGDPILDTITPLLQGISKAIYSIIEVSDAKKLRNSFKEYSEAIEEANSTFSKTTADVESAAYMAGFYAERLEELQEAGLNTAAAHKEYQLTVQKLNELIPDLNLSINEETGLINDGTLALKANIKAWQEQATAKALQEKFSDILEAQAKAEADLLVSEAKLNTLRTERTAIESRLAEKTEESRQITEKLAVMQEKLRSAESLTAEETERLAQEWDQLSARGVAVIDEIMGLSRELGKNKDAQAGLLREYENAKGVIESYSDEIAEARDAMALFEEKTSEAANKTASEWKGIRDAVTGEIDLMQKQIDKLSGKTVYVDVITRATSAVAKSSQVTPSFMSGASVEAAVASVASLPHLATGAVIPPKSPFLAVLGDQPHGTNVEAPLSTIQEAVALVMEDFAASNIAGQEAIVGVLREILEAVLGIEIGDDVIGQAVARYNRKNAVITGG